MTPNAPPPPRFGQDTTAKFTPEIDGRWYTVNCRRLRILGGWLLPGPRLRIGSSVLTVDEPIVLTGLKTDGRPREFSLQAARLSVRWLHSSLQIDGSMAGERVRLRLDREANERC